MKPFNLELAKQGHKLCFRNNPDVEVKLFKCDMGDEFPILICWRSDPGCKWHVFTFFINGHDMVHREGPCDLMMAPTKRIVWVNLYRNTEAYYHASKADANAAAVGGERYRIGNRAWPLEIEE